MPGKKRAVDIRDLVSLAVAADLRNVSFAAEHLSTTQSTLSRQVGRMEGGLGVTVFRHGWSGTATTRAGDNRCQHALALREVLQAAERRLFADRDTHPRLETSLTLAQPQVIDAVRARGARRRMISGATRPRSAALGDVQHHLGIGHLSRNMREEPAFAEIRRIITDLAARADRPGKPAPGRWRRARCRPRKGMTGFFVREDSPHNTAGDGRVTGFSLAVRNASYRGCYLSADGEDFGRSVHRIAVNGREHRDCDDEGVLHVALPGGPAPGWTRRQTFQNSPWPRNPVRMSNDHPVRLRS